MSAIADTLRLLEGESAVFAFLPGINYFFYFLQQSSPQTLMAVETLFALLVSAFLYNFLTNGGVRDPEDSAGDGNGTDDTNNGNLSLRNMVIFVAISLPWVLLFGKSLSMLQSLFNSNTPWAQLLVAVSAVFVFLLISDITLYMFVSGYGGEDGSGS